MDPTIWVIISDLEEEEKKRLVSWQRKKMYIIIKKIKR